jgi:hypothetical protein
MRALTAPIGAGDLIDRIAILSIKAERMVDPAKRAAASAARDAMIAARDNGLPMTDALTALAADLRAVNEALWDIENLLRAHEARGDFGMAFVALARSVYRENDRRAAIKPRIDLWLGAPSQDPKEHSVR